MLRHARLIPGAMLLALVACSGTTDSSTTVPASNPPMPTVTEPSRTSSAASVPASSTSAPATAAAGLVVIVPDHVRSGTSGVVVVRDGVETTVVTDPVDWAGSDDLGGVVYRIGDQVWWQPDAGAAPVRVEFDGFPTSLDGRAVLVGPNDEPCGDGDGLVWAVAHDLVSGEEDALTCVGWLGDSGTGVTDLSGGRFVVEFDGDYLNYSKMGGLTVADLSDTSLDLPGNPYPLAETCGIVPPGESDSTCEVHGRLSADGRALATWYRPDFVIVVAADGMPAEIAADQQAWLARIDTVPAVIRVSDLDSGADSYRTQLPARTRIADFDGRFLVVACRAYLSDPATCDGPDASSTIIDITGQQPPIEVPGNIALLHPAGDGAPSIDSEHPALQIGDTGAWVSFLQQRLVALGASIAVDGVFGPGTESAVRDLQTGSGLAANGVAGPSTWSIISA